MTLLEKVKEENYRSQQEAKEEARKNKEESRQWRRQDQLRSWLAFVVSLISLAYAIWSRK
ncbi:MAG: hypothetical protein IT428_31535 [Planctomycetaceae bacterium]|nr:hypothetical protein [Planctomycetaceae bacterium]